MHRLLCDRTWTVMANTQGARWPVVTGLPSREAASRALDALLARDGLSAADATGRKVAVTFGIEAVS